MRVIAIDPGFERLGIAIVSKIAGGKETVEYSECFRTPKTLPFEQRLKLIGETLTTCIKKYKPEVLAIESLFFSNNKTTAIGVAGVRGVILYVAAQNGLLVREFNPATIKIAVTGYGKASKEDVEKMVGMLVTLPDRKRIDDELDAIAIGLTALAHKIV